MTANRLALIVAGALFGLSVGCDDDGGGSDAGPPAAVDWAGSYVLTWTTTQTCPDGSNFDDYLAVDLQHLTIDARDAGGGMTLTYGPRSIVTGGSLDAEGRLLAATVAYTTAPDPTDVEVDSFRATLMNRGSLQFFEAPTMVSVTARCTLPYALRGQM